MPTGGKNAYYYPHRLTDKIDAVRNSSTTIVEAPVAYGKTALIHDILQRVEDSSDVHYFTCVDDPVFGNYVRLCKLLCTIDEETGKALLEYGIPDDQNAERIAALITDISCEKDYFLVLDSFQYLQRELPIRVVFSLLWHISTKLHIIIITQYFRKISHHMLGWSNINHITQNDLTLSLEETEYFLNLNGKELSPNSVSRILSDTDGIIGILALLVKSGKDLEHEYSDKQVKDLLPAVFYDRLSETEKEILLRLSVFSSISKPLISYLTKAENTEDNTFELLHRIPLVTLDPGTSCFLFSPILRSFLQEQVTFLSDNKKKELFITSGEWFKEHGDVVSAVYSYYSVGDYEAILSLELTDLFAEKKNDIPLSRIFSDLLSDCSPDVKRDHPLSLLRCAYYMYAIGDFDCYQRYMDETKYILEQINNDELFGEWLFMSSFGLFPDIEAMRGRIIEAGGKLRGHVKVLNSDEPFMFGCISMLFLFYQDPGIGDETVEKFTAYLDEYKRLTDGHGNGADVLMKAELAFMRCDLDESEILAYKAAYLATNKKQYTLSCGAAFLLGRIAAMRNDNDGIENAIQYIDNNPASTRNIIDASIVRDAREIARSILISMSRRPTKRPSARTEKYPASDSMAFLSTVAKYPAVIQLILEREYKQAIGDMEAMLLFDTRVCALVFRLYVYAGLTICYYGLGKTAKALENLEKLTELSDPDGLYAIFIRNSTPFLQLLTCRAFADKYSELARRITQISSSFTDDRLPDQNDLVTQNSSLEDLTDREMQVARLAAQGMRNKEISQKLHITEGTVKNHMKIIFQKMGIDRRSELIKLLND